MSAPPAHLRVAAAQVPATRLSEGSRALGLIDTAIADAAARQVDLLVLPEGAYPSYYLLGVAEYRAAGVMPNRDFLAWLGDRARRHRMHVICGYVEDQGDCLCNAAALVNDAGDVVGIACKSFLWGDDNRVFRPGDRLEAFDTRIGRIGIAICADVRAPETTAGLAALGAQLIAVPTCWVNVKRRPGEYYNPQPDFLIEARGLEIGVPFVCANKFGVETDTLSYCGFSLITDADARVLAKAPPDAPALLCAEVQPTRSRLPAIPAWARLRLFDSARAEEAAVEADEPVKIAAIPSASLIHADGGMELLRRLAAGGVVAAVSALPSMAAADDVALLARTLGIEMVGYAEPERMRLAAFGGYAALSGDDVRSFAPARALSLDGAAVLFVIHPPNALPLLRARAVENRVVLAAAGAETACIIGPDGAVLAQTASDPCEPVAATVDLASVRDKIVFPGTHIFEQRKPRAYAAAFGEPT